MATVIGARQACSPIRIRRPGGLSVVPGGGLYTGRSHGRTNDPLCRRVASSFVVVHMHGATSGPRFVLPGAPVVFIGAFGG